VRGKRCERCQIRRPAHKGIRRGQGRGALRRRIFLRVFAVCAPRRRTEREHAAPLCGAIRPLLHFDCAPCARRLPASCRVHYVFLIVIAALAIAVYLLLVFKNVPGAVEERLGTLEPLPEDLGVWQRDAESSAGRAAHGEGLVREVRTCLEDGKLVRQVRYKSLASGDIVRTEKDERIKRRRVKS
jgi:hypothetical protein